VDYKCWKICFTLVSSPNNKLSYILFFTTLLYPYLSFDYLPLISEGDYLVVSWQDAWEIKDDTCFIVGLYKNEARLKMQELLK
jgi:hypothetical protein